MVNKKTNVPVANIGSKERRKRLFLGLAVHAVTLCVAAAFIHYDVGIWWRAGLFLPFWLGFLGLIQAQLKTCVMYAAKDSCNMDNGVEKIKDGNVAAKLRKKAKSVYITSLVSALFMTIMVMVIR